MNIIKSFFIAISMYSKIPTPQFAWNEKSMRYALAFFPFVGIIIGALQLLLFHFVYQRHGGIGSKAYAALATAVPIVVTGGIHMDGYCDTIDALSSHQPRENRLKILKDSNSGAFAIIWTCIYFVLYYGAWTDVHTYTAVQLIAAGYLSSRALSGLTALFFPNANKKGSLASFSSSADKGFVCTALILVFAAAFLWQTVIVPHIGILALMGEIALVIYYYKMSKKNFGGITGDLAGWFLQCTELLVLYLVVLL